MDDMVVLNELTKEGYPGSVEFQGYVKFGKIKVVGARIKDPEDDELKKLGPGEKDIIKVYKSGIGDYLLIDDGKGAEYCKNNGIPFINALLCARVMLYKKIITDKIYKEKHGDLLIVGRYSQKIVDIAEKKSIVDLDFFI